MKEMAYRAKQGKKKYRKLNRAKNAQFWNLKTWGRGGGGGGNALPLLEPRLALCIKSCLRLIIDLHVVEARFGNFANCWQITGHNENAACGYKSDGVELRGATLGINGGRSVSWVARKHTVLLGLGIFQRFAVCYPKNKRGLGARN